MICVLLLFLPIKNLRLHVPRGFLNPMQIYAISICFSGIPYLTITQSYVFEGKGRVLCPSLCALMHSTVQFKWYSSFGSHSLGGCSSFSTILEERGSSPFRRGQGAMPRKCSPCLAPPPLVVCHCSPWADWHLWQRKLGWRIQKTLKIFENESSLCKSDRREWPTA